MKTRKFRLEKLVHDGIVEDNKRLGIELDYEVLPQEEWVAELEAKLTEEMRELKAAKTDVEKAKEQQDVDNVLFALGKLKTSDFIPTKTFNKRHFVHILTIPAGNEWAEYYAKDPQRFPEITE